MSKSLFAASPFGNTFSQGLSCKTVAQFRPVFEAIGNSLRRAVNANGYSSDFLIDHSLGERVAGKPDEA
jgi:hypothetical protein